MKKLLVVLTLLFALSLNAQNAFDNESTAAHSAVAALTDAAEAKVAHLVAENAALSAHLDSLLSTTEYPNLEWHRWGMNCAAQVGGSGNGTGSQSPAPNASFSLAPVAPASGAANYVDCYFTDDFLPDDMKKSFSLTMPWKFPTTADSNASQALEMEIRQSVAGGLQGVCALQMNFSGNQLRIFDHVKKWLATGVAQPKFVAGVVYVVTLDCHRDALNSVVYDAITINGTRTALSYSYPYWQDNWRPMMRIAGQLDGRGAGTPYTVKRGATLFKAW